MPIARAGRGQKRNAGLRVLEGRGERQGTAQGFESRRKEQDQGDKKADSLPLLVEK